MRCPLSSCSNKNDGPRGRFNCISTVSCKGSVFVEVLTNFYGRFFVEEGQFIKYTPSTSSLHSGSHFFHLLTPPRFGALNLPEVNQFTGNCFYMVRISHIGMYRPKGYGFCAISIRKKDSYANSKLISRKLFVGVLI